MSELNDNVVVLDGKECEHHQTIKKAAFSTIIFILITFLICVCAFAIMAFGIKDLSKLVMDHSKSAEFESIYNRKLSIDSQSTVQLKGISERIKEDIRSSFDMDELEKQLNSGIVPKELEDIFRKHLEGVCTVPELKADSNNIVVANHNGIISDFSHVYAPNDINIVRNWNYEKENEYNQELFENSISAILNQDSRLIYAEQLWGSEPTDDNKINYLTKKVLKQIYIEKGLEGLKPYTFFIPVYINDRGDIFGKNDIINGKKVENNKFIIIQRYSLYQYLMEHNIEQDFNSDHCNRAFNQLEIVMYLCAIIIMFIMIAGIVHMMCLLNKLNFTYECNVLKEANQEGEKSQ